MSLTNYYVKTNEEYWYHEPKIALCIGHSVGLVLDLRYTHNCLLNHGFAKEMKSDFEEFKLLNEDFPNLFNGICLVCGKFSVIELNKLLHRRKYALTFMEKTGIKVPSSVKNYNLKLQQGLIEV